MEQAYLYIRVSTDEQAAKGFSQRSQEDRLLKYCNQNNIYITDRVFEDYSAKDFNRPEWLKLIHKVRTERNAVRVILFTRWDRFSRNAADAYQMIREMKKLGVELRAIDQPLDLEIPESKIMLAIYLATSEVENDRRGLNIRYGMYRAKQEGRWVGHAPIGYLNTTNSDGQKCIVLHEPEASLIRSAFEEIAMDRFSTHFIYKQLVSAGLKCSRSNFWCLLKNPVYCGKIVVPEFEKQKQYTVKGQHEKIISAVLFDRVQKLLTAKGKVKKNRTNSQDSLPLRGFLICPECRKKLTGSASRSSNYNRYYYYHCSNGCRFRASADETDRQFIDRLKEFIAGDFYVEVYTSILKDVYKEGFDKLLLERDKTSTSIEGLISRSVKAHELLLRKEIDADDYISIKEVCEKKLTEYCRQLQVLAVKSTESESRINNHMPHLSCLDRLYINAGTVGKRELIGLLLPDLIIPFNLSFNITRAIGAIYNINCSVTELVTGNKRRVLVQAGEKYLKVLKKQGPLLDRTIRLEIVEFLQRLAAFELEYLA